MSSETSAPVRASQSGGASGRRWWITPAVLGALVVAAAVWATLAGTGSYRVTIAAPNTRDYKLAGTYDGVSFWIRTGPNNELATLATGRLGSICDGAFEQMPIEAAVDLTLCNDAGPTGGVESALVPVTTHRAFVNGVPFHVLPHTDAEPADLTLAVLVVGPGIELPQGAIRTN